MSVLVDNFVCFNLASNIVSKNLLTLIRGIYLTWLNVFFFLISSIVV